MSFVWLRLRWKQGSKRKRPAQLSPSLKSSKPSHPHLRIFRRYVMKLRETNIQSQPGSQRTKFGLRGRLPCTTGSMENYGVPHEETHAADVLAGVGDRRGDPKTTCRSKQYYLPTRQTGVACKAR